MVCLGSWSLVLLPFQSPAQSKDTSLLTLHAVPYYYNVVKTPGGDIVAGTSDGMYRMEGPTPKRMNGLSGYVTVDAEGNPVIDSNGIKYHDDFSMGHLLPFPQEKKVEYHAGKGDHFYIAADGKMHVYELLPYRLLYRNHSVRTISPHWVGTYSGLYYQGKKQAYFPSFCDGYIREINGYHFINYSDLIICKPAADTGSVESFFWPITKYPDGGLQYFRDVYYSPQAGLYYVNTTTSLAILDSNLQQFSPLFSREDTREEVVLLGEDDRRKILLFANGPELKAYSRHNGHITDILRLPGQILDGYISRLNYFLLTANGLFVRRADNRVEQVATLEKAHTLYPISQTELVIATDNGLFLFNTVSGNLTRLIPGVEFNRRALFVQAQQLYAGSIRGLYVFDISELDKIAVRMNTAAGAGPALPGWVPPLAASMVLLIALLAAVLLRYRKKIEVLKAEVDQARPSGPPKLTRQDIIDFVHENLPTASINSITDRFEVNTNTVYSILEPDKPGALIQEIRLEKVQALRQEGATAKEIASVTGLSESYVRKIWNKLTEKAAMDDESAPPT